MAMMGGRGVFVDTNVLVYVTLIESPFHARANTTLAELSEQAEGMWVSRQVLREYLSVLTRPQTYARPVPVSEAVGHIRDFVNQFNVAEDGAAVTERLLELAERFEVGGKQVHDANIVATMLAHDIAYLLTHNVRDFERYSSVISVIPLEG